MQKTLSSFLLSRQSATSIHWHVKSERSLLQSFTGCINLATTFTFRAAMSSGLSYSPGLPARGLGSHRKQIALLSTFGISVDFRSLQRNGLSTSTWRCKQSVPSIKCSMDATFGDARNDSTAIFPRINVKDPYKRLGISKEASEDEIQAARNFLIQTYGGHKPSVDAIEAAHDKIIMQKFYDRKNPKVDVKKKVREVTQHRYVQAVTSRFRTPSTNVIVKTSVAFIVLGVLTVLFPTEEGPTLQVALSFIATMYFIYDRLKNKLRAFLYGAGSFAFSWLLGTFLMVSVMPPILKGPRNLEVTTSLLSYIILWVSSTYLR